MRATTTRYLAATVALGAAALAVLTACSESYDFERKDYERESLGDELHAIWIKDARRAPEHSEAKTTLLEREEEDFVRAVNTLAPEEKLGEIDHYLRNTVPSTRSGLLPSFTRKLRRSLEMATRDDRLLQAMVPRRNHPPADAYVSADNRPNLPRYLLQYDDIRGATTTLGDTMLGADGVDEYGKPASGESTEFRRAQRLLASSLAEAESTAPDAEASTPPAMRDILLVEDGRFQVDGRQTTLPGVRFDHRGYPLVRRNSDGDPIRPFVDQNDDGLADVDDRGRFVFEGDDARQIRPFAGDPSADPFERDDLGRAQTNGDYVFDYIDLAHTGADFLVRQAARLHERGVLWKLADGLPALLGERTTRSDDRGEYRSFTADQPLTDFLAAAAEIFALDQLPGISRMLARFVDTTGPETAELIDAIQGAKETIDAHPDAELTDDSTIGYDLLPLVEEISSDPELWSDVLAAMREPIFARLGDSLATMITYADQTTLPSADGGYEQCFQKCKSTYEARATEKHPHGIGTVGRFECIRDCPTDELFAEKTDFSSPEAPDNRSVSAQIFHLLRDTAGVTYEMRVTNAGFAGIDIDTIPPIMRLPGAAEAFIATIAGNLHMEEYITDDFRSGSTLGDLLNLFGIDPGDVADLLSTMSGLFGTHLDPSPTPDQVTRMFNQKDLKFQNNGLTIDVNEPVCKDGYKMARHLADKLFASEASGLIDTVQPLAKAFSDHDREELLAELFVIFHEHYSAHEQLYKQKDGTPSPMKGANFRSFEPPLLEIIESGRAFEALHEFALAIDRIKSIDGVAFEERLRQLVHHAVERDGDWEAQQLEQCNSNEYAQPSLKLPDGDCIEHPSRLHVLLYRAGRLVDRLEDDSEAKQKLQSALSDLGDVFLTVENNSGSYRLKRPGTFGLLSLGLRELSDRAERWKANNRLETKLTESWRDDLESLYTGRALPLGLDTLELLGDDPERKRTTDDVVTHLVGQPKGRRQLTTLLYQTLLGATRPDETAPIANFLGAILDPDRNWDVSSRRKLPLASHGLTLLQRTVERDQKGTGFAMMHRGTRTDRTGTTAFGHIGGVILDYYRRDPASEEPYTVADYRHSFSRLADWLGDDVHGLEQFYDIIRQNTDDKE